MTGEVAGGARWFERQVRSDIRQTRRVARRGNQRVQVGQPRLTVLVGVFDQWCERGSQALGVCGQLLVRAAPQGLGQQVCMLTGPGREVLRRERPSQQHLGVGAGPCQTESRDHPSCGHRADALDQLQQAEPGQLVTGVVGESEQTDEVLDVCSLQEPQTPVLHVRDATPGQLELEQVAVVSCSDQHRLLAQRDALLPMCQNAFAHRLDLRVLVRTTHQLRSISRALPSSAVLAAQTCHEPGGGVLAHGVGHVEDVLGRPVVAFEQDGVDRREHEVDLEQVLRARTAEPVDRLGVVADDGQAVAPVRWATEGAQYVHLERVDVLVLVDADVVDLSADQRTESFVGRSSAPVEEEVVEVQQSEHPLAGDVRATDVADRLDLVDTPGRHLVDHRRQGPLRVDRT